MRYCRFEFQGQPRFGLVERIDGADKITRINTNSPESGAERFVSTARQIQPVLPSEAKLLAPVQPSKIVVWDATIARTRQKWAMRCPRSHSSSLSHHPRSSGPSMKSGARQYRNSSTLKANWES